MPATEQTASANPESALAALERFVVDNDDLLALEERIGRFNIFDALGIARAEIRHSNFLAWLLNPSESHGQGSLFLKAILMDVFKEAPARLRPFSPIELDGEELRGVEVLREWKSIDILIKCQEPPFVIAIENKIDSGEHSDQLQRYEDTVQVQFPDCPSMFVYLTTDSSEPSDDDWVSYSYTDLHRALERVRTTSAGAIGDDVSAFLEHYLRLIGNRFMDDPAIVEHCQRIYRKHRQALDLIWDRVGIGGSGLLGAVSSMITEDWQRWHMINVTSKRVAFLPAEWLSLLPAVGARKKFDPRVWLTCNFEVRDDHCHFAFSIWPTTDSSLRTRIIERLIQNPKEFGFTTPATVVLTFDIYAAA